MNTTKLDSFTRAYIECALWSSEESLKEDASQHEDDFSPAEKWDVNIHCLSDSALASITEDCAAFQSDEQTAALLSQAFEGDYNTANAGHDFWLTRNGHGAGFWDRGLGKVGALLTGAAKVYGSSDLYFGDDGKLHIA